LTEKEILNGVLNLEISKKAYLNVKRPCGILRKKLRIQGSFVRLTRVQQIKILTACICDVFNERISSKFCHYI
jgi:hypothetical protein